MYRFKALLLAAMLLGPVGPAQADDAAIRQVIADQLAAFEADDFTAAFDYASPTIRGIFGTPERFGRMVRQGYPMVHRPADHRFLEARESPRGTLQRVMITDAAGRLHLLEYEMIEAAGRYLINGVRILRAAEAGV
jgi:hypothetical protein